MTNDGAVNVQPDLREIPRNLQELGDAQDMLVARLCELQARLEGVMTPGYPTEERIPDPCGTPMGGTLAGFIHRTRAMQEHVETILNRLEL